MAYKLITDCPVCGDKLKAVKLSCSTCGTNIESEFSFSKFEQLTPGQLSFAEIFIKCRGSIKEAEKELGISYPTVKAKLNDVIKALGYDVSDDPEPNKDAGSIIDSLEKGELSPEDAVRKLKNK